MAPSILALSLLCLAQEPLPEHVLEGLENRLPHLRERLECDEPGVRKRALKELTCFAVRDSGRYPPLLRQLLTDPDPEIRWQALAQLDEHGIVVPPAELPRSVEVPLVGTLDREDPGSLARMRAIADQGGARAGWAIRALGLVGDREAVPAARALTDDGNLFARHSAAVTLLQLGPDEEARALLRAIAEDDEGPPPAPLAEHPVAPPLLRDPRFQLASVSPTLSTFTPSPYPNWYTVLAAERLVRLGESRYVGRLVALMPVQETVGSILEDLTGEFHATEAEWREWWERERERHEDGGRPR